MKRNVNARAEQLGNRGVRFQQHGDDTLALFDGLLRQAIDLSFDPLAFSGGFREEDQAQLAGRKTFVDGLDEVIAGEDLPLVHPGFDAFRREQFGDFKHTGLVDRAVAAKDLEHFGHRVRDCRLIISENQGPRAAFTIYRSARPARKQTEP